MNAYRALMRKKILEEIYDSLSEEDRRLFVQLTLQDKGWSEIMQALQDQDRKLDRIRKGQSWWLDLGSNITGNAVWDSLVWIGSRLLRKI